MIAFRCVEKDIADRNGRECSSSTAEGFKFKDSLAVLTVTLFEHLRQKDRT